MQVLANQHPGPTTGRCPRSVARIPGCRLDRSQQGNQCLFPFKCRARGRIRQQFQTRDAEWPRCIDVPGKQSGSAQYWTQCVPTLCMPARPMADPCLNLDTQSTDYRSTVYWVVPSGLGPIRSRKFRSFSSACRCRICPANSIRASATATPVYRPQADRTATARSGHCGVFVYHEQCWAVVSLSRQCWPKPLTAVTDETVHRGTSVMIATTLRVLAQHSTRGVALQVTHDFDIALDQFTNPVGR